MRVISPVSLPTYLSVVYRNNMSAVPASIHLKTNVDRIYLLLLKTVLSFPSLLSKTMSIFQDFFKTFLQFSQIQDYFQDLNEFINFKTFSSLEENVRTIILWSESSLSKLYNVIPFHRCMNVSVGQKFLWCCQWRMELWSWRLLFKH